MALIVLPRQILVDINGTPRVGAKMNVYQAGTTTPITTYTTAAYAVAHANPIVSVSSGFFPAAYVNPAVNVTYKVVVTDSADDEIWSEDNIPTPFNTVSDLEALSSSAAILDSLVRTAAEIAAGVTPTNYAYPPGDVRRYGAVGDGSTDDTAAIQNAINSTHDVYFPPGTYQCALLTQSTAGQRLKGAGNLSVIQKNANGALFTSSAANVELDGLAFRGDAAAPTFTGHNIVSSGDHFRLINCGSRWAYGTGGRAVLATGNHVQIRGTCDIYQTADAAADGYDIEIGVSGTATLYHQITNIYTSQNTGGIRLIDTGSAAIVGSQFGKLFVDAGTSPAGVNGGTYACNRIGGAVVVEVSNALFSGNHFNSTITLEAGTSEIIIDATNAHNGGTPLVTNNGNGDNYWAEITSVGALRSSGGFAIQQGDSVVLEGTVVGTDGLIQMSVSDNLQITNESSADAVIITQTGAGTINMDVNGARSAQFDANATAGNTRFLIYDVDNATLERVSVGGVDSGGAGFKLLRIPN